MKRKAIFPNHKWMEIFTDSENKWRSATIRERESSETFHQNKENYWKRINVIMILWGFIFLNSPRTYHLNFHYRVTFCIFIIKSYIFLKNQKRSICSPYQFAVVKNNSDCESECCAESWMNFKFSFVSWLAVILQHILHNRWY